MAREAMVYGFRSTLIAVPAGLSNVVLVPPIGGEVKMTLKYVSGGSLELFHAYQAATDRLYNNGVSLGSGYLFGTSESLTVDGAPKFYLAATGATAVASLLIGISQANSPT